jgi:hypothetical protein
MLEYVNFIILLGCAMVACALSVYATRNWAGDKYLCDTCRFNTATLCLKQERPKALQCAAYRAGTPREIVVVEEH